MRTHLLLLFCCLAITVQAQYIPQDLPSVPSPSAASLGQFGEVPVSLYTGLPVIEVPLYTLQEQGMSVPIALRYHASGFRPDQHPGLVGMGWALEAGGVISRSIQDLPDEDTWDETCAQCSPGYYYTGQMVSNTNFTNLGNSERYNIINNGALVDSEPDEFSFSFGSYSGTFYWDAKNGIWRVKCDRPVKVITDPAGLLLAVPFTPPAESGYLANSNTNQRGRYRKTFRGFTIITEEGIAYSFGGTTNNIEYSVGLFSQLFSRWTANSWYLTKITHPDGGVIDFTYTPGEFICQPYLHQTSSALSLNFYNGSRGPFSCDVGNVDEGGNNRPPSFGFGGGKKAYTGSLIRPVYLNTIKSLNGLLTFATSGSTELRYEGNDIPGGADDGFFNYRYNNLYPYWGAMPISWRYMPFLQPTGTATSTSDLQTAIANLRWQELKFIFIQATNRSTRTINFTYNDNPTERLRLLAVQESGSRPYKFDYNISVAGYPALPGYFADKTDHWGFYNNRAAGTPSMFNDDYYATREPAADTTTALLGMLRRITYPTGGVTDFRFEQHRYSQQLNEDRSQLIGTPGGSIQALAGGVRLRATKSYSLDDVPNGVYKEYFYVKNYSSAVADPRNTLPSSGILGGQSKYRFDKCYRDEVNSYTFDICQRAFSSQSILAGCVNSKGSHIGYSEVIEKQRGGGYTRYKYSNFDVSIFGSGYNARLDDPAQYMTGTWASQSPFSSREQERGNLLAEETYNNNDKLVKNHTIGYMVVNEPAEYVEGIKSFGFFPCPMGVGQEYRIGNFAYYKRYTYACLPASESTTLYDVNGSNPVTSSEDRGINSSKLLSSKFSYTSTGDLLYTLYTYPNDYPYNGAQPYIPTTRAMALMQGHNILNKPIAITEYKNWQITQATVALYTVNNNDVVVPSQVLQLNPKQPLPYYQYSLPYYSAPAASDPNHIFFVPDSNLKPALTFGDYDGKVHPGSITKPGGVLSTQVWDYKHTLLAAKVDNATPAQVAYTSFESDGPQFVNNSFIEDGLYGWNYDPNLGQSTHLQTGGGVSGRRSYLLDGGWSVNRGHLPPGTYELTFWAKGGWNNIFVFPDSGSQLLGQYDDYITPQDFHLLRARIRVSGGSVSNPTGSVAFDAYGRQVSVDDVRLYPVGARMVSYTYDPLVGVTSTSDANSRPVLYEYDNLHRLSLLRDQDGNVVKTYQYNLKP